MRQQQKCINIHIYIYKLFDILFCAIDYNSYIFYAHFMMTITTHVHRRLSQPVCDSWRLQTGSFLYDRQDRTVIRSYDTRGIN